MYNILIVDDEKEEREGLRFLLSESGCELRVFDAKDGMEALEVLGANRIDILITDICMPHMNGLDLLSEARKINEHIVTMIYSAYDKFDYAQRAIREKTVSYILKPIDPEAFLKEFARCVEICAEEGRKASLHSITQGFLRYSASERKNLWQSGLYDDGAESGKGLPPASRLESGVLALLALMMFPDDYFANETPQFEKMAEGICDGWWLLDESRAILIKLLEQAVDEKRALEYGHGLIQTFSERAGEQPAVLIARADPGESVIQSFELLDTQYEQRLFRPGSVSLLDKRMKVKDNNTFQRFNEIESAISRYIAANNMDGAINELEELQGVLDTLSDISAIYTRYTVSAIIDKVCSALGYEIDEKVTAVESVWSTNDTIDLIRYLNEFVDSVLRRRNKDVASSSDNSVINRILEAINEKYYEDWTLGSISQLVYMAPSYVSHLFRKHTGQTLIRYLNQIRLIHAAEMLLESDARIMDIMQAVGFSNSSYFGAIFRTKYGLTPYQYRKMKGAEKK